MLEEVFPSIEPKTQRAFLRALRKRPPSWPEFYAKELPPEICQGDILDPVKFIVQDDDGDFGELDVAGMILSHSCDIDDETWTVAACQSASAYAKHRSIGDIRNNTYFPTLFLGSVPHMGDQVVDFGTIQSVRRSVVQRGLESGAIVRRASLTQLGYYFVIAKLTIRWLRAQPEDEGRRI